MCFLLTFPQAKTVELETAKTVAKNYFALRSQAIQPTKEFDVVIENKFNQNITYYICSYNDGGFVIVSGDDSIIPILGYSLKSIIQEDNIPPALQDLLNYYNEQINYAIDSKTEDLENLKLWNNLIEFEGKKTNNDISFYINPTDVDPLISTTWDQGCYYNAMCPTDIDGQCGHVWTGCAATAMAQVMKYWNHPETGSGSYNHPHPTYGVLSADFGATTYNWLSMPNTISTNNDAIATLMYHCGVALEMNYGPSSSGADPKDKKFALINYFKYSQYISYRWSATYSTDGWKNLLKDELNHSRPIIITGSSGSSGSHDFVCDGFSGDKFHINWGWSGSSDGNFYLNNLAPGSLDYSYNQFALIGIEPPGRSPPPPPPSDIIPPVVPTGLAASAGDGFVTLNWNANTEADLQAYFLFKDYNGSVDYSYLIGKTLTNYTDYGVINGITYYYAISAIDSASNQSDRSPQVNVSLNLPSIPKNVVAIPQPGAIYVSWDANTEPNITGYWISKGTSINNIVLLSFQTATSFQDKNVEFGTTYYYQIAAKNDKSYLGPPSTIVSASPLPEVVSIFDANQIEIDKIELNQNFPNPFNPVTSISYGLLNNSEVKIDIYNLTGRHIISLVDEQQESGAKVVEWNGVDELGRQVDSGIYFYKLQVGDFIQTRKMVLMK